jgi:hypothetical protein
MLTLLLQGGGLTLPLGDWVDEAVAALQAGILQFGGKILLVFVAIVGFMLVFKLLGAVTR